VPCGDELEFELTGTSIANATACEYVEASPLMRAIARLLAGSGWARRGWRRADR
jgi:hypothetical protein